MAENENNVVNFNETDDFRIYSDIKRLRTLKD